MKHAIEIGWRWDALLLFDPPDVPLKGHPLYEAMEIFENKLTEWANGRRRKFATVDELTEEYRQSRATARWVLGELLASSAWVGTLVFSGALFTESYGLTTITTGLILAAGAAAYVVGNVVFRRVVACRAHSLLVRLSIALGLGVALFGIIRPSPAVSTWSW